MQVAADSLRDELVIRLAVTIAHLKELLAILNQDCLN